MANSRVWADSVRSGARCRDEKCGAMVTFAVNVKTGRAMPFTGELAPVKVEQDEASGRAIWTVDLATSHFATCPGANRFRR